MNISIRKHAIRGVIAAAGLALAFGAGAVTERSANATQDSIPATKEQVAVPVQQFVYYLIDSNQTPADIALSESITAQERFLAGVLAPQVIVRVIDDSDADRTTAMEAIMAAAIQ